MVAPLAALKGEKPPAPAWFERALQQVPQRRLVPVDGAGIEMLTWGEVGRPGLLFLHGSGAHADWWSFIAPLFASDYRVAALSWSGMGGSQWRDTYSMDRFVHEALAVADAAGLMAGPVKPVFVAHSFGGFPTMACAARNGDRLRAVVLVDVPMMTPEQRKARKSSRGPGRTGRPNRVYPTLAAAMTRFRFAPDQPCENLYIADHIARTSLQPAALPDGGGQGWTWRFDPFMWRDFRIGNPPADLAAACCPVAIAWGSDSRLADRSVVAYMKGLAPAGAPMIEIPAAHHHVMVDQPLAFVTALRGLLAGWPAVAPRDSNF